MKLGERYFSDDGKLIVEKMQASDPYKERALLAREVNAAPMSESWHVASLPAWLVVEECKKAGVMMHDHDAVQEVMFRMINDSDFGHFRVKEGRV